MDNEYKNKYGVLTYREATLADASYLAQYMRDSDKLELRLSSGDDLEATLEQSFKASSVCRTACINGIPCCIFGVAPLFDEVAAPWMVATKAVYRFKGKLITDAQRWLESIKPDFSRLVNFVHAENTTSIAWLSRLGFTVGGVTPEYGVGKAPFRIFHMETQICAA